MTKKRLREVHSLMCEIIEEEERRYSNAAWSLFGDDHDVIDRYRERLADLIDWIDQIDDSQTRRAFRLRYVDGLSWLAVGLRLGYGGEAGARKLCARYLEKQKNERS